MRRSMARLSARFARGARDLFRRSSAPPPSAGLAEVRPPRPEGAPKGRPADGEWIWVEKSKRNPFGPPSGKETSSGVLHRSDVIKIAMASATSASMTAGGLSMFLAYNDNARRLAAVAVHERGRQRVHEERINSPAACVAPAAPSVAPAAPCVAPAAPA